MTTRVIGLGQAAAGDDGVGLAVLQALRQRGVAPAIELFEESDAAALIDLLQGAARAVVVDAAVVDGPPGRVLRVRPEALRAERAPTSSHGIDVGTAIAMARTLHADACPDIWLVAVTIEPPPALAHGLSDAVRDAIPKALREIDEACHA